MDSAPSNDTKCLFSYRGNRHITTLSSSQLHLTRLNPPLIGDSNVTIELANFVGIIELDGPRKFEILAVSSRGNTNERTLESFILSKPSKEPSESQAAGFLAKLKAQFQTLRKVSDKKLLVLVNPFGGAGKARSIWKSVRRMFAVAQIKFEEQETNASGHALQLAKTLPLDQYYGIVCVSGDGLLAEVLNGLLERDDGVEAVKTLSLGIIPGGSGNGLAASLDASDPITAAFAIIKGETHALDIFSAVQGDVTKFGFLSLEWATLSVIDLQSEDYRWLGPLRFDVKGVAEIMSCLSYKGRISFLEAKDAPDDSGANFDHKHLPNNAPDEKWKVLDGEWAWFLATNTPKITKSAKPIAPNSHLADGFLDLFLAPKMDRSDLGSLLLGLDDGSYLSHPLLKEYKVKSLILEPDTTHESQAPLAIDGERAASSPIRLDVYKGLAKVFCDHI